MPGAAAQLKQVWSYMFGGQNPPGSANANGDGGQILKYLAQQAAAGYAVAGIVLNARDWMGAAGFEYWLGVMDIDMFTAAAAAQPGGLDAYGWSIGSSPAITSVNGDVIGSLSSPGARYISVNSGSQIYSPLMFGGYIGAKIAERFLGATPTKLVAEFWAAFGSTATNQTTSWLFGMTAGSGQTDAAAAGSAGCIVSDGANFRLRSAAGNDAGAAVDTNWHLFRIEYGATNTEWFIDGVSQGTIATETGIWPRALNMRRDATGNQPRVGPGRIYYAV